MTPDAEWIFFHVTVMSSTHLIRFFVSTCFKCLRTVTYGGSVSVACRLHRFRGDYKCYELYSVGSYSVTENKRFVPPLVRWTYALLLAEIHVSLRQRFWTGCNLNKNSLSSNKLGKYFVRKKGNIRKYNTNFAYTSM